MDDRCPTMQEFERRAAGKLTPVEVERFDRHLSQCEACGSAYAEGVRRNQFLLKMKSVLARREGQAGNEATRQVAGERPPAQTWTVDAAAPGDQDRREYLPRIEGYSIRRVLGRGGMGVVYEAVQTALNRPVALKLLPAIVSSGHPHTIERFHREAEAAARLHHRNIISIYDFGESRDGYYYAMELIEGQTMSTMIKRLAADPTRTDTEDSIAALLRAPAAESDLADFASALAACGAAATAQPFAAKGRFYYTQVAHWIAQVADALHYAHLNGLVHRDIKPSNVMLCTDGRILVLDFGLVKSSGDESVTMSGSLVGTYRYMSPEQLGAKRIPVDARTDIYSLGATLYELLTFQPAFKSTQRPELLSEILFRDATPPRKVIPSSPLELSNICLKAMEKAPSARYQSAGAMAEDLRRYINDLPIIARHQGPWRRAYKFIRRHRVGSAAISAIVVLALAALLIHDHQRRVHARELETQRQEHERLLAKGEEQVRTAYLGKGTATLISELWQEALETYESVLRADPHNVRALLNVANAKKELYYYERDETLLVEALAHIAEAWPDIKEKSRRGGALNLKGVILRIQGRLAESEEALKAAREVDPDYYPVWANLGTLHALQGRLTDAEAHLFRAVELARQDSDRSLDLKTAYNLAVVQLELGRADAIHWLEEAWRLSRKAGKDSVLKRPELKLLWAKLLLKSNDPGDAERALRAAVATDEFSDEEDDPRPVIKRFLALAELRNEQWRSAVASAQDALMRHDMPSYAYLIMAIARARLGDRAMAEKYRLEGIAAWPAPLNKPGELIVTEDWGMLWIDAADELIALQGEAERLIGQLPVEE